jgi:hypothetical protein
MMILGVEREVDAILTPATSLAEMIVRAKVDLISLAPPKTGLQIENAETRRRVVSLASVVGSIERGMEDDRALARIHLDLACVSKDLNPGTSDCPRITHPSKGVQF